jgi:DNA-directed RNA polymerase specialized sigma subunit
MQPNSLNVTKGAKMTAKEYLNQYGEALRRERALRREYEEEQLLIDAIKSTSDLDGMPHGGGPRRIVEEKAIRLNAKWQKWKEAEIKSIELRQEIFDVIFSIDGLERDILVARYIKRKKWRDVPDAVHASYPTVIRHHQIALEMVEARINKE